MVGAFHITQRQLRKLIGGIANLQGRPGWPVLPLVPNVRVIIIPDEDAPQGWIQMKARN